MKTPKMKLAVSQIMAEKRNKPMNKPEAVKIAAKALSKAGSGRKK